MKNKRWIALLSALALCLGLSGGISALAAEDEACAVVGADLTNAQTEEVYALFGLERGGVRELSMTNAEERSWLEGYVEESVIGTASLSSVYIQLLPAGSGTEITTHKLFTLLHDPMYRCGVAWQNNCYNQPCYTSFYYASDMDFRDVLPGITDTKKS